MKKEFSFYEFVGILVPSVTLLFFTELIIELVYGKIIIDFSKIGDSIIFLIIAYGFGHILHAIGNFYENIFWKIYGGMPTMWLFKKNRFNETLFDDEQTEKISRKIYDKFGQKVGKDYGRDVYNWLSVKEGITEKRIDIFNANYSLFRGLTMSFYILTILILYFIGWKLAFIPFALGILANVRMVRFAKNYAKELFRTFQTLNM